MLATFEEETHWLRFARLPLIGAWLPSMPAMKVLARGTRERSVEATVGVVLSRLRLPGAVFLAAVVLGPK